MFDILWHLNGHHQVFASKGCAIPKVSLRFKAITLHIGNMSADEIECLSSKLFDVLQAGSMNRPSY